MFGKFEFRVLTQRSTEAAKSVTSLLRKEGIEVYDLKTSELLSNSDNSVVELVYVLCCRGRVANYKEFKLKYKLDQIMYEGFRTLM